MKKVIGIALAATVGLASSVQLQAHHSHAMFDTSRELSITGTVTSITYTNPHVFLYVDVKGSDGQVVNWAVEMSNILNMSSRGIYKSTFKPGDVITVKLNPLRDGRPGGNYTAITAADGKSYN